MQNRTHQRAEAAQTSDARPPGHWRTEARTARPGLSVFSHTESVWGLPFAKGSHPMLARGRLVTGPWDGAPWRR